MSTASQFTNADDERRDAPQRQPDEERDREEEAEEHGEPAPAEVVVADDEANRVAARTSTACHAGILSRLSGRSGERPCPRSS